MCDGGLLACSSNHQLRLGYRSDRTNGVDSDTGTTTDVTGFTTSEMLETSAETNMASLDFVGVRETVSGDYPTLQALLN